MFIDAIVIKESDNVATALATIEAEHTAVVGVAEKSIEISVRQKIPFGHKLAVRDIAAGEDIIKYGEVIGRATQPIRAGEHAHVHNIESLRGRGDLTGGGD